MAITITWETKRDGQKTNNLQEPKKGRELVPLVVGSYLTHSPSIVTCMQIVKFNNNGRSKTRITCQCNFRLYSRTKAC
jgi:hypothetical protein